MTSPTGLTTAEPTVRHWRWMGGRCSQDDLCFLLVLNMLGEKEFILVVLVHLHRNTPTNSPEGSAGWHVQRHRATSVPPCYLRMTPRGQRRCSIGLQLLLMLGNRSGLVSLSQRDAKACQALLSLHAYCALTIITVRNINDIAIGLLPQAVLHPQISAARKKTKQKTHHGVYLLSLFTLLIRASSQEMPRL